jgi:hypothetical protein
MATTLTTATPLHLSPSFTEGKDTVSPSSPFRQRLSFILQSSHHSPRPLSPNDSVTASRKLNFDLVAPSLEEATVAAASTWTDVDNDKAPKQHGGILHSLSHQLQKKLQRVPPRYRALAFLLWILWKFVLIYGVAYIYSFTSPGNETLSHQIPLYARNLGTTTSTTPPVRILYIVTSLAEYDSGHRSTTKGKDRLATLLLPVLVDSVESLTHWPHHYQVDVYLILAYTLSDERRRLVHDTLAATGVGVQIWDQACPAGYENKHSTQRVIDNTRALARQHRYVIKDKLPFYDLFLAFEDDMRITGAHVAQFMTMSQRLETLRRSVSTEFQPPADTMDPPAAQPFFGPMSRAQLDRLIPGFVRVEVLLNATINDAQATADIDPVPLNYHVESSEVHFDARPCCQIPLLHPNVDQLPVHPTSDQVVVWETSVRALSVRQLPNQEWVVLLPGPGKRLDAAALVGGYWSGRTGAFGPDYPKPSPGMPDLIAQQGGWMATPLQLWRLNDDLCQGTFLPPFNEPIYRQEGLESMNVEFYSGGYQFFTGVLGGCNMQRVVSLNPAEYSNHFLYHVANNKQRQLAQKRMVRADVLWAQLNHLRNEAAALVPPS